MISVKIKNTSMLLSLLSLASCVPPVEEIGPSSKYSQIKVIQCSRKSSPTNPDPYITYSPSTAQIKDDFCVGTRVMYGASRNVIPDGELRPYVYGQVGEIESYDRTLNSESNIQIKFDSPVYFKEKELYKVSEISRSYNCVWRADKKFKVCQGDAVVFNYNKSIYEKPSVLPSFLKDLEDKMKLQNDESGQIIEIFSNGYANVYNNRTGEAVVFPLNRLRAKLANENYNFDCDQNPYDGNCQLGY